MHRFLEGQELRDAVSPGFPEMDQQRGGTPPVNFASDLEELRTSIQRFRFREADRAEKLTQPKKTGFWVDIERLRG
jgi:hypothetical protein